MDWAISREKDVLGTLAYTIGYFLGDGCLSVYPFKSSRNGKTYYKNDTIIVSPDRPCLERCQAQMEEVFGKRYPIYERELPSGLPFFEYKAYRREIFDFFAVNTRMRQEFPRLYFSAPKEIKKELLRGLMDSDGHVSEFTDGTIKRWQIGFSNNNRKLVEEMASLLQQVGVKVGKISEARKTGYSPTYIVRPNNRSFIEAGMFFYSNRRQGKLNRYRDHVLASETLRAEPVTTG